MKTDFIPTTAPLLCFFCKKGPMTLREDPGIKSLVCACGEQIFVDYRCCEKGCLGFGPTGFITPVLKYWTEEIAIEWYEFEAWKIDGFLRLGCYSDKMARDYLGRVQEKISKWREEQKHKGFWRTLGRILTFRKREQR